LLTITLVFYVNHRLTWNNTIYFCTFRHLYRQQMLLTVHAKYKNIFPESNMKRPYSGLQDKFRTTRFSCSTLPHVCLLIPSAEPQGEMAPFLSAGKQRITGPRKVAEKSLGRGSHQSSLSFRITDLRIPTPDETIV
jgi:hypothetical protein